MFERIARRTTFNFIHAIAKCCSDSPTLRLPTTSSSVTLHAACSIIQMDPTLADLNALLTADITTFFYCHRCSQTDESLKSSSVQIFIFNHTVKDDIIAHPVLTSEDRLTANETCERCRSSIMNVRLPIYKQTIQQCPAVLFVSIMMTESLSTNINRINLFRKCPVMTHDRTSCSVLRSSSMIPVAVSLYTR